MQIHPAAESDHDRILSFIGRDPAGWVDAQTYNRYIASGSYGADRIWLAEADGHIVACAVWYGGAIEAGHCLIIDCLWVEAEPSAKAGIGAADATAGALRDAQGARSGLNANACKLPLMADWFAATINGPLHSDQVDRQSNLPCETWSRG